MVRKLPIPDTLSLCAKKLRQVQKALDRKQKGSNNQQREKVAQVHGKIADSRKDFLHKLTTQLVRENQTIVVEDLAVKNMVKTASWLRVFLMPWGVGAPASITNASGMVERW